MTKHSAIPLLQPRYQGERFREHRLPLELLEDLAELNRLLRELAKVLYREENEGRQRIPRKFFDPVQLELGEVQEGSALPQILLTETLDEISLFTETQDSTPQTEAGKHLLKAKELVVETLYGFQAHNRLSTPFPPRLLPYLSKMGKHLRVGESMDLDYYNGAAHTVRYTPQLRQTIKAAEHRTQDYTEEFELLGRVVEFDSQKNTCTFKPTQGSSITLAAHNEWADILFEAFGKSKHIGEKTPIYLAGEARYTANGQIKEIINLSEAAPLDPLDIRFRMEELMEIPQMEVNGETWAALNRDQAEKFTQLLEDLYLDEAMPLPHLYLTPEGNIQAEWTERPWDYTLEVDMPTFRAAWSALNLDTQENSDVELDLSSEQGRSQLKQLLQAIQQPTP